MLHQASTGEPAKAGSIGEAALAASLYIRENHQREISMAALARGIALSAWRFSRVFRQQIGVSPRRYLCEIRVRRAQELISAGLPLAEIAAAVGFYDQSHLNRHFKRVTGITPGRYARTLRTGVRERPSADRVRSAIPAEVT